MLMRNSRSKMKRKAKGMNRQSIIEETKIAYKIILNNTNNQKIDFKQEDVILSATSSMTEKMTVLYKDNLYFHASGMAE